MRSYFLGFFLLLAWLTAATANPAYHLPDIGRSADRVLSANAEKQLGDYYMEQLRYQELIAYDPLLADYLQQLTDPLVQAISTPHTYTFFLVNDPSINAFAMPGGYIGLHTGLIKAARTESELASVIAHEMAHVSQRHIARFFERRQQQLLPTLAALLGSALVATHSASAGMGAMTATMAGAHQSAINFTRENEQEADRIGMTILQASGYDPQGMPDFFGRMWENNRYNLLNLPEFLSTHPVSEARIADSQQRASRYPSPPPKNTIAFLLAKVRVDFLNAPGTRHRPAAYASPPAPADGPEAQAARYGHVLALLAAADCRTAQQEVQTLRQLDPANTAYRLAEAETLIKLQEADAALELLKQTYRLAPASQAAALHYADYLLSRQDYHKAQEVLRKLVTQRPETITALRMLAEVQANSGQRIAAHQTRAEILALQGDYLAAIEQLRYALHVSKGNQYATQSLQARISALQAQEKLRAQQG